MPRPPKVWTYTYHDLAKLTDRRINTIQQAASRGKTGRAPGFDPDDFRSVVLWIFRNSTDELRLDMMAEMGFFKDPAKAKRIANETLRNREKE